MATEDIQHFFEELLERKLAQQKREFIAEVSEAMSKEIESLNALVMEVEIVNSELKRRVTQLEREKEIDRDNVATSKLRAGDNDQYARRTNMVVFGVSEEREDSPVDRVREITKEKLKINLKADFGAKSAVAVLSSSEGIFNRT